MLKTGYRAAFVGAVAAFTAGVGVCSGNWVTAAVGALLLAGAVAEAAAPA